MVSEKLEEFLEEHPAVGKVILEKAMTANRAWEAARRARENIRRKNAWREPPPRQAGGLL